MTASIFGAAFDKLSKETQAGISQQLRIRMIHYIYAMKRGYHGNIKFVIIGDTPGPGRPTEQNYHHTPFYSTKNSSLWLNRQLVENNVDENTLLWFNAELADGSSLDPIHIQDTLHFNATYIVLGGKAEAWFKKAAPKVPYRKVYHPQFAKRFKSKEPYELIEILKELT